MSTKSSSSAGLGCTSIPLSILLFGGAWGAWLWSQGADPRAAVGDGLVFGAQVTGGLCLLSALIVGAILLLAAFVSPSRRRW
jgi:hypothetical protein